MATSRNHSCGSQGGVEEDWIPAADMDDGRREAHDVRKRSRWPCRANIVSEPIRLRYSKPSGSNPSLLIPGARISISGSSNGNNGVYTIDSVTPIPGVRLFPDRIGWQPQLFGVAVRGKRWRFRYSRNRRVDPPRPPGHNAARHRTYIIDKDIEGQNY